MRTLRARGYGSSDSGSRARSVTWRRRAQRLTCRATASYSNYDSVSIPPDILAQAHTASGTWLDACRNLPLVASGVRVHLLGTCHFAPQQQQLLAVQQLIETLQPAVVALEQPLLTSGLPASAGEAAYAGAWARPRLLPYPPFVDALMGAWEQLLNLSAPPAQATVAPEFGSEPLQPSTSSGVNASFGDTGSSSSQHDFAGAATRAEWLQQLWHALRQGAVSARVGRDVLDPQELFGFYPGLDFVTSPGQIAACVALFGFAPGLEYASAVQAAQQQGAQVLCIDAPLKLQEAWVRELVADFKSTAHEAEVEMRLRSRDLQSLQQATPSTLTQWDLTLPSQVERRTAGMTPDEQMLHTITAFKVARACASACLPYADSNSWLRENSVLAHALPGSGSKLPPGTGQQGPGMTFEELLRSQARLQPLKYRHFERRVLHLGQQLLELCGSLAIKSKPSTAAVRKPPDNAASGPMDAATMGGSNPPGEGTSNETPPPAVLVLLGRQYIPALRALWSDGSSTLYRGTVPHTFTPSVVEPQGRGTGYDPDVEHGGSRPVGQEVRVLGQGSGAEASEQAG